MLQIGDSVILKARYTHTIFEDDSNFRIINVFAPYEENRFPFASSNSKVEVIAKGTFAAPDYRYQELEIAGEWKYDIKHKQYELGVHYIIPALPTTEKGVKLFCITIPGIGKKIAERISSVLKKGFVLPSGEEPDVDWFVASIKGMTEKKSINLCAAIRRVNVSAELTKILKNCVSGKTVQAIAVRYGSNAINIVYQEPYRMFLEKTVTFFDADEIASAVGKSRVAPERIQAGIIAQMRKEKESRNTIIVEKDKLLKGAIHLLNVAESFISTKLDEMYASHELVSAGKYCYTRKDFETEKTLAVKISELVKAGRQISPSDNSAYLAKFEEWKKANLKLALADKQEDAVKAVANNYLSVLTGGPGTGKTTVLKAIMETYRKTFPQSPVTLMAPASLASKRMSDDSQNPRSCPVRMRNRF